MTSTLPISDSSWRTVPLSSVAENEDVYSDSVKGFEEGGGGGRAVMGKVKGEEEVMRQKAGIARGRRGPRDSQQPSGEGRCRR